MGFPLRFRDSLVTLILGFVLLSFICSGSGATSSRRINLVLAKPYAGLNEYYNEHGESVRLMKRSSRPSSDTDYLEDRRGAFDHHGRTLIFKSLILAPLALVVLILFLIILVPIPVISTGRSYQSSSPSMALSSSIQMARDVLTAEECIERVSCELSKISRSFDSTSWIPSTLERLLIKAKWSDRIIRGMKGISSSACSQFTCTPAKHLKRTLKNAVVAQ